MPHFDKQTLMARTEMEVIKLSPTNCVMRMPVDGNRQTAGVLHGGASAALAETAGSLASREHARTIGDDFVAVGVELSIQHIRPAKAGYVTAAATAMHLGRTRCVHRVDITDEGGRLISTSLISNQIIKKP